MSVYIKFKDILKKYENNTIIEGLNLEIRDGELFTLLGPSGCGKTTLLRMVAGFNSIEGGEISFGDKVINNIPAHKRNIGMVFQNYAIFPHMTVEENVEYGLKIRNLSKEERSKKIDDILKVTQIEQYRKRLPERLSGGQQQRVALARAIIIHPDVLLMDEPLSNLDAKLRIEMRESIRTIQKEIGITTVYVTHDQEEALAISDRIAVMKDGIIQHLGTPEQIYLRPKNIFVATFIGHSNILDGKIVLLEDGKYLSFENGYKVKINTLSKKIDIKNNEKVKIAVRPEEFILSTDLNEGMKGKVVFNTFLGKFINYEVELPNKQIIELSQNVDENTELIPIGKTISLLVNANKINVYNETGEVSFIDGVM